ncbi:BRO family protein [Bacillus cereus]|uniref:BRO family protein n=1 Tax=Bacillus cereus TaxID=1396 RepID=UPI0039B49AC4
MNQLQVFNNEEFGQVRTVKQGEDVWFVAKDVSDILGFSEAKRNRHRSKQTLRMVERKRLSL